MTLKISGTSSELASARRHPRVAKERSRLEGDVVAELTSWNPREFIVAFRRWHRGELSLIHLNVLSLIDILGPLSMGKLAETLDVSIASATGIVDRMETRGLVERRHTSDDRRVVLVHLTEGGLDVFRDIDQHRREGLARLLQRLSDDELAGLLQGHRALRAARATVTAEPSGEDPQSPHDPDGPAAKPRKPR